MPGDNDSEDHLHGIADVANSLTNVIQIDLQPYHPLGQAKNTRIGRKDALAGMPFPEAKIVNAWQTAIQAQTGVEVKLQSGAETQA